MVTADSFESVLSKSIHVIPQWQYTRKSTNELWSPYLWTL